MYVCVCVCVIVRVIVCDRVRDRRVLRNDLTRFHKVKESDAGITVRFQMSVEQGGGLDGWRFGWSWIFASSARFPKSFPVDIRGMTSLHAAVLQRKWPWTLRLPMSTCWT